MSEIAVRTIKSKGERYVRQSDIQKFLLAAATYGKTEREIHVLRELANRIGEETPE